MKTTRYVLFATLVLVAVAAQLSQIAQAETCYQLRPFSDILRLNVEITEGTTNANHEVAYGNWVTGSYTLPVVGARELNVGSSTVRRLGIHGTNDTAFFGNNPACVLDGIPGGAWSLTCFGGAGSRFTNSGSALAPLACSSLPPFVAGPEAGR
jgi:hypothetical protein